MNAGRWILVLAAAFAVITMIVITWDPQQGERIARMQREVAFTGQARDTAMIVFFVLIGGFVAYLIYTRK
jgi:hypothetical protein